MKHWTGTAEDRVGHERVPRRRLGKRTSRVNVSRSCLQAGKVSWDVQKFRVYGCKTSWWSDGAGSMAEDGTESSVQFISSTLGVMMELKMLAMLERGAQLEYRR